MTCNNCESKLPEKGFFCPKCGKQSKCKSCNELLEKEANACIYCGEKVNNESSSNKNLNSIEYKETRDDRTFKASFTDSIGENISHTFASFLANKFTPKPPNEVPKLIEEETEYSEIISSPVKKKVNPPNNESDSKGNESRLIKLFRKKGDVWTLVEPRLKAANATDYGKRLTLLFLALKDEVSEELTRKELGKILTAASVNTGNVRRYLANNSDFNKVGEILNLTLPGIENSKKILEEVYDDSIENKWDVSQAKNNVASKKSISHKTVDLGLGESDRTKLREFAELKKPKFQNDIVLTIMLWLKENKGKDSLNMDEIHTGIQIIGKTTPKSLVSVMNNIKGEHKIDKLENDFFQINKIGTDYVKLQLPKVKKK